MPTYLLSWNPNHWHWPSLAETAASIAAGERVTERWSCGKRTPTPREIEKVQERIEGQVAAGRVSFSWRRGG
ncbi:MAG: hypothetical protein KGS73_15585 [Chloroflexi bacterium]|nr:hypothetical protein [Chloroflexota bacterium]